LWQHLGGRGEESVHLADFPRDTESLIDPAVVERWERLLGVREEVNRALENARQGKIIGTSLGAHVTLTAGGSIGALLRRYEADLPMLFIVSQVSLEAGAGDGLAVSVARAEGTKCERCWRVVPDVSRDSESAGLCSRCVAALQTDAPRATR
jgi:isoleucyl-tRNA synthetase